MPRHLATFALLAVLAVVGAACTDSTTTSTSPDTSTTSTTVPSTTTTATSVPSTTTTATSPPSTTTTSTAPAFVEASCPFSVPGRSVECGWLEVPADRGDPASDTISLRVAVFESESPNPAPDPVVYLEGGPGGDSLEIVPLLFEDAFAHLLADRDVIFFDQRGTGYSEPSLACPELRELGFDIIDEELPIDEVATLQLGAVEECRDRLLAEGADLDAHTSANSAADLAELRLALGVDEWNVYGTSYGTRLALTTMRDHPEGIRSVVLDSAYPLDADILSESPANLDRALGVLFDGCAADAACAAAYPDLAATFYALLRDLDESPLRAPVTDLFTGEVYDAVFSGGAVGSLVFQSLYSPDVIPALPRLIDDVADGDTYELSVLTSLFAVNSEFVSIGMQLSVQCHEEAVFTSPDAVAAALEGFPQLEPIFAGSPNLGSTHFEVCERWGAGQAPPLENEPVRSSIPTLVLAGEYDPITPPAWGEQAASTLEGAMFVEFPGQGHGPSAAHECPQEILRGFLDAPGEPVDTGCVADMGPPEFVTAATMPPPVVLVPYTEEDGGVTWSGVVPDGWERQDAGVWARAGASPLDQTALIQQVAVGPTPAALLSLAGTQFGLGDDPEPVEEHVSPAGTWSVYDGALTGAPASVAFLEITDGTAIVVLVASPSEIERLRSEVLFQALDAFSITG